MGIIGAEHNLVLPDQVDDAGENLFIWITRNVALAGKILGGLRFERGELLPEKHLVSPRFA